MKACSHGYIEPCKRCLKEADDKFKKKLEKGELTITDKVEKSIRDIVVEKQNFIISDEVAEACAEKVKEILMQAGQWQENAHSRSHCHVCGYNRGMSICSRMHEWPEARVPMWQDWVSKESREVILKALKKYKEELSLVDNAITEVESIPKDK